MQTSHIPNALCYRILFFHLWWTPTVQSKQSDMVQPSCFPSPLSYFQHYLSLRASAFAKRSMAMTSRQPRPDICSANSGGNLKPSCPLDLTECRAGHSSSEWVSFGLQSYGKWRGATNCHHTLTSHSFSFQLTIKYNFSDLESTEAGLSKGHLPTCQGRRSPL